MRPFSQWHESCLGGSKGLHAAETASGLLAMETDLAQRQRHEFAVFGVQGA